MIAKYPKSYHFLDHYEARFAPSMSPFPPMIQRTLIIPNKRKKKMMRSDNILMFLYESTKVSHKVKKVLNGKF